MNSFLKRTLFGTLFAATVIGAIYAGSIIFALLFLVAAVVCIYEFHKITDRNNVAPQKKMSFVLSVIIYLSLSSCAADYMPCNHIYMIIPLVIAVYIAEVFRNKETPHLNIALTFLPAIYIAVPFGLLQFIYNYSPFSSQPHHLIFGIFILQWISDTFAYITGITIGKHKILPLVSPKKSWEGYFGGIVFSFLSVILFSKYIPIISRTDWMIIAAIISVAGPFGDFIESSFKRSAGIKDSSELIPGHGGLLDRFDAFIISIPLIFFYLYFIK